MEVLVVLGLIGILIALLIPAVQRAREASRRARCSNNLRQIGLALSQYTDVHGQFPSGDPPGAGRSAFVAILPYLEAKAVYDGFNFDQFPTALANMTADLARPACLVCPSDYATGNIQPGGPGIRGPVDPPDGSWPVALTSYGLMYGSLIGPWQDSPDPEYDPHGQMNGCFNEFQRLRPADVTDGLSQTIFCGERAMSFVNADRITPFGNWTGSLGATTRVYTWHPPNRVFQDWQRPTYRASLLPGMLVSSLHGGGANVLFGDASVRFIKETINSWPIDPETLGPLGLVSGLDGFFSVVPPPGVWQALSTRAGGEVVGEY